MSCQRCPLPPAKEQTPGADWKCPRCGEVWTFQAIEDTKPLTPYEVTRLLADEAWEGRWSPLEYTNIYPLASHTAEVLHNAGYDVIRREDNNAG